MVSFGSVYGGGIYCFFFLRIGDFRGCFGLGGSGCGFLFLLLLVYSVCDLGVL